MHGVSLHKMPWWQREPLVPLQSKSTMMVCAPTNSGKTRFVKRLLENADTMYTVAPKNILCCYSIWQPIFDEMQRTISKISFHQGLPDEETIVSLTSGSAHSICVLDDLMDVASDSAFVQKLFFAGNHFNLTTINIVQNVFIKGRVSRCCSLNTHYFVLFRNPRDVQQIHTLGRQMFYGKVDYFMNAFQRCTQKSYQYILVDISPHSDRRYQLRTDIFPGEDTRVFLPLQA